MRRIIRRRHSTFHGAPWRTLVASLMCVSVLGSAAVTSGSAQASTQTAHAAKLKWSAGTTLVSGHAA